MALLRAAVLALLTCALGSAGCTTPERSPGPAGQGSATASPGFRADPKHADSGPPLELTVLTVRPGLDAGDLFVTYLEPAVDAPVVARVSGLVRSVLVREGQPVGRGAVLARLDSDQQRLEYERARALSAQADAELARAEKGAAGAVISRQQYDAARARSQAARADLALARLALAHATLRAPVTGIVWQVRAESHRPVTAGDVLFRVTDPSRLKADLYLPASFLGAIRPGDVASLRPASEVSSTTVQARVRSVSPLVDPATGRFHIELEAQAAGPVAAGTSVRASFAGARSGGATDTSVAARAGGPGIGAVLPRGAYLERHDGRLYAWVVRQGIARRVPVELGFARADGYDVLSGLAAGELVLAAGQTPPPEGAAVSPHLAASRGR